MHNYKIAFSIKSWITEATYIGKVEILMHNIMASFQSEGIYFLPSVFRCLLDGFKKQKLVLLNPKEMKHNQTINK